MANEVKLEVYTIQVRPYRDMDGFLPLDNLAGGEDFLTFFQRYIQSFDHQLEVNENQQKTLILDSDQLRVSTADRTISGIIESGDYGFASKFLNIRTEQELFQRSAEDTEILPFYFLLHLPENETKGYLMLQRFGIHGINSIFRYHLSQFLRTQFNDLKLEMQPVVSTRLFQELIREGNIKEYRLTRYNLPADVTERLGIVESRDSVMSIEVKIVAKRRQALPLNNRIRRFVNNPNAAVFDVRELTALGFDGDHQSKIMVELGGQKRVVDLSDTGQIRPYYDIDHEVEKNETGHPVFDSIDRIAREFLVGLLAETNPQPPQ